jgi:hypothetical protein
MVRTDGRPCGAPALREGSLCFWHAPEKADEVAEARKLGGLRRRRERTVAVAYDLESLDSVASIRRIIEIALFDALGLESSIPRARVLIAGALAAAKLLETGELASRIEALESALGSDREGDGSEAFPRDAA